MGKRLGGADRSLLEAEGREKEAGEGGRGSTADALRLPQSQCGGCCVFSGPCSRVGTVVVLFLQWRELASGPVGSQGPPSHVPLVNSENHERPFLALSPVPSSQCAGGLPCALPTPGLIPRRNAREAVPAHCERARMSARAGTKDWLSRHRQCGGAEGTLSENESPACTLRPSRNALGTRLAVVWTWDTRPHGHCRCIFASLLSFACFEFPDPLICAVWRSGLPSFCKLQEIRKMLCF